MRCGAYDRGRILDKGVRRSRLRNLIVGVATDSETAVTNINFSNGVLEVAVTTNITLSESRRNTPFASLNGLIGLVVRTSLHTLCQAVHMWCLEVVAWVVGAAGDLISLAIFSVLLTVRIGATIG